MPSHGHVLPANRSSAEVDRSYGLTLASSGVGFAGRVLVQIDDKHSRMSTLSSGSSWAHNNMPAYQSVYAWRRTG